MYGLEHDYRFLRPLGKGAEGEVWRAEDLRRGGLAVTWKRLSGSGDRIPQEFRTLASLRHPTLAPVLDSGLLSGGKGQWFTSPYFPGIPLDRLPEPLDARVLEGLLHRSLTGLVALNEAGWRHGDLKPDHLLWTGPQPWRLRIIDLGHAARLDDPAPARVGTPPYAGPELWGGPIAPGRNTDLYALGMIALEVLRGGPVILSSEPGDFLEWHREGDRDSALDESTIEIPDRLRDVIRSCLAPDPADRPRDAESLLHRLRAFPEIEEGADAVEIEIPIVGRDRWIAAAMRDLTGPSGPAGLLLMGPAGIGRTRLLRALAARVRATSGIAIERSAQEPLDPRALSTLAQRADARVLLVDDVGIEDGEGLERLWTSVRRLAGKSSVRLVAAVCPDIEAAEIPILRNRLARVAAPMELRAIPGLDRESYAELAIRVAPDGNLDIGRRWRESGGTPGSLLGSDSVPVREEIRDRESDDALGPVLVDVLSALPIPVPLPRLAEAIGVGVSECLARIEGAGPRGPALEGMPAALSVFPRSVWEASPIEPESADALLRLAELWRRDDPDAAWVPWVLSARAGREGDVAGWQHATARARSRDDLAALAALAEVAPENDLERWLALEVRHRLGETEAVRAECPAQPDGVHSGALPIVTTLVERIFGPQAALPFARARLERSGEEDRAAASIALARLALSAGRADECAELIESDFELERLDPPALLELGVIRARRGETDSAEIALRSALAAARGGRDPATVVGALSGICGIERQRGELPAATRSIATAIRYARAAGIEAGRPELSINQGAILHSLRRSDEALASYRRAAELLERRPDHTLVPHAQLGIGTLLRDRGDLIPAVAWVGRAVRSARDLQAPPTLAAALGNLGELYLLLGNPRRSQEVRAELLEIAKEAGQPALFRQACIALAAAEVVLGHLDRARQLLLEAESASGPAPLRLEAWRHSVAADLASLRGDDTMTLRESGAALRDALRSGRAHTAAASLRRLARLAEERGDVERAIRLLRRGLALSRQDPAPALSRLPLRLELCRLSPAESRDSESKDSDLTTLGREAFRIGLAEELLIATEGDRESLPDELVEARDRCLSRLESRYGVAGVAALGRRRRLNAEVVPRVAPAERLASRGDAVELRPLDRGPSEPVRDPVLVLEALRLELDASVVRVLHRPARVWRTLFKTSESSSSRAQDPPQEEVRRTTPTGWEWWIPLPAEISAWIWIEGAGSPTEAPIDRAELTSAVTILCLQSDLDREKTRVKELRGRIRRLREEGVRQREHLETRLLTQRLELHDNATPEQPNPSNPWIIKSEAMRKIDGQIPRWARSELPLILWGESGTGKTELIRRLRARCEGPFISENCAALPEPLLEAELFGYRAGAFTGADRDHDGLLVRCHGGTLVLDHLDELPPALQAKLLRVVDGGTFRPLGSDEDRVAQFRWVATFRDSPEELIESGALRSELYYRLQGLEVRVPPLRERREEIIPLVEAYLSAESVTQTRATPTLSAGAVRRLEEAVWPGNVRELVNACRRWVIEGRRSISPDDLVPAESHTSAPPAAETWGGEDWRTATDRFHRSLVAMALARYEGNQTRTAKALGISRRHLLNLLDRLDLRKGPGA